MLKTNLYEIHASVDAAFELHQIPISDGLKNFLQSCVGLTLDGITKQVEKSIAACANPTMDKLTKQTKQNIEFCDSFIAKLVREIHNFFACIILGAISSSACKWSMENIIAFTANIPTLSTATTY